MPSVSSVLPVSWSEENEQNPTHRPTVATYPGRTWRCLGRRKTLIILAVLFFVVISSYLLPEGLTKAFVILFFRSSG